MGILSTIGSWFSAPANAKPDDSPVAPEDRMRGRSTADAGAIVAGLTPAKMLSLLRTATTGQIADQADLFFAMEEGDPDIGSSLAIRRMGVLSCGQGQVLPADEDASVDDATMQRSVDLCEQAISTLDRASKVGNPEEGIRLRRGWRGGLRHLLDAIGSGIAAIEPQWETSEKQWFWSGIETRPLKWFQLGYPGAVDGAIRPDELRLRDGTAQGARVNPMNFWIHQVDAKSGAPAATSLLRQLARLYVIRNYAWKDLLQFGELFGVPLRVGSWRDGATEEEKQALYAMLLGLSTNAVAVKHKDDTIEFPTVGGATSGGQGSSIFERMLSMTKDSITLLVQGQLATSGTGSGFSNQSAQQNVRWDLLDDDAYTLEETIRWQCFAPLVWFNLGPNAPVPKYQFPREEPRDSKAMADTFQVAVGLGIRIPRTWAQEKLGIPEPDEDEETLQAPAVPSPFGVPPSGGLPAGGAAPAMPGAGEGEAPAEPLPDGEGGMPAPAVAQGQAARAQLLEMVGGISGMIDILKSLRDGTITRETAIQMVMLFYRVDRPTAENLINTSGEKPPEPESQKPPEGGTPNANAEQIAANAIIANFDPGQPRDEQGQWTSGGSTTAVERKLGSGKAMKVTVSNDPISDGPLVQVHVDGQEVASGYSGPYQLPNPVQSATGTITHAISTRAGQIALTSAEAGQVRAAMDRHTGARAKWQSENARLTNEYKSARDAAQSPFDREQSSGAGTGHEYVRKAAAEQHIEELRQRVIRHRAAMPPGAVAGSNSAGLPLEGDLLGSADLLLPPGPKKKAPPSGRRDLSERFVC